MLGEHEVQDKPDYHIGGKRELFGAVLEGLVKGLEDELAWAIDVIKRHTVLDDLADL